MNLNPGDALRFTTACAAGEKAIGGGSSSDAAVIGIDDFPLPDGSGWVVGLMNVGSSAAPAKVYVVCVK